MTFFFDLDGTLLDHEYAQRGGLSALAAYDSGLAPALSDDFLDIWRRAEAKLFPRVERGEFALEEYRRERLRDVFPDACSELSDTKLDQIYEEYLRGYQDSWRLYPDVESVLPKLKGPRALITNGASILQRAKIARLNLNDHFSGIYISGEVGLAKPDTRLFAKACAELGVAPGDVHYVGDSIRNDIEGSASAGITPIWINRERVERPRSEVAFKEILSLKELLS
jgi:putative hydrolase of the HAD superfamily